LNYQSVAHILLCHARWGVIEIKAGNELSAHFTSKDRVWLPLSKGECFVGCLDEPQTAGSPGESVSGHGEGKECTARVPGTTVSEPRLGVYKIVSAKGEKAGNLKEKGDSVFREGGCDAPLPIPMICGWRGHVEFREAAIRPYEVLMPRRTVARRQG
jgi:hypothetical protein